MGIIRDRNNKIVVAEFYPSTLNNVKDPIYLDFDKGECAELLNVDITERGISRRQGYTQLLNNKIHSGWNSPTRNLALYIKDGVLTQFDGTTELSIKSVKDVPASYCEANEYIVFANGFEYGWIKDGLWYDVTVPNDPFKIAVPIGTLMCFYNGRLYIAKDNIIYCTDPFTIEYCDERNYVVAVFDGNINMLSCVDTGIWVGTDKEIFFLSGDDSIENGFTQISITDYGCILGTAYTIKSEIMKEGPAGAGVLFASYRGICVGFNDGVFKNLTQEYYTYDHGQRGCSLVRFKDGYIHFVCNTGVEENAFNQFEPVELDIDSY